MDNWALKFISAGAWDSPFSASSPVIFRDRRRIPHGVRRRVHGLFYIVMTRTAYTSVTATSAAGRAQANQALHPTAAGAMLGGRG